MWPMPGGVRASRRRGVGSGLLASLIQAEIDAVNARMPQVQQVREFRQLVKELDQDDGEVTVTMKVRRKAIAEKYADLIEKIDAQPA